MAETARALLDCTVTAWGQALSDTQLDQFALYANALQHWNERVNLTSITDTDEMYTRHFLDSLSCMLHWGNTPHTLLDIGSGAGFPGLPLKLACPELHLTLVESVGKKAAFLRHIVEALALAHVTVLETRAERVGHDPQQREHYDVVTARAVSSLSVLAEYSLPLLRVGGRLLAPKGAAVAEEAAAAQRALAILGGHLLSVEAIQLPGQDARSLVVIEKTTATPPRYPRAVGVPARRPL
jgi:16S rRNA (guanine527-N7)-methyltransferase